MTPREPSDDSRSSIQRVDRMSKQSVRGFEAIGSVIARMVESESCAVRRDRGRHRRERTSRLVGRCVRHTRRRVGGAGGAPNRRGNDQTGRAKSP